MPSGGRNGKKSSLWSKEQAKEQEDEISKKLNYEVITEVVVDPGNTPSLSSSNPRQGEETYSKEETKILSIGTRFRCLKCDFVAESLRQFECHLKIHCVSYPLRVREPEVNPNNAVARISTFNLDQLHLPGRAPSSDDVLQDHSYSKPHQPGNV